MIKVLFVCLGNICRSPLAEAIFKKMLQEQGLEDKISCDSAGTSDYHIGELPDERTIANATKNGLTLNHRGRQINKSDFSRFDYILAMDKGNYRNIALAKEGLSNSKAKIFMMRQFENSNEPAEVPDPYYGGAEGFQKVYEVLQNANRHFVEYLKKEHSF